MILPLPPDDDDTEVSYVPDNLIIGAYIQYIHIN